jgi:hypothetical protein
VPEGQAKRSGLSQVATVSLQPEEPTTETRNKEALSRVVMTAMRMYGLEQRKKSKSRQGSAAPGAEATRQLNAEEAAEGAAKDEEYKLIYHQTFKGAVLALVSNTLLSTYNGTDTAIRGNTYPSNLFMPSQTVSETS